MSLVITKIKDTDPAIAATFNTPITELEAAVNANSKAIGAITNREAIVVQNMPISSDCSIGMALYYNAESGVFSPAYIRPQADTAVVGKYMDSPEAHVSGILVYININGTLGSILISGKYTDESVSKGFTEDEYPAPGAYYLTDKPGVLGRFNPDTADPFVQPVLVYLGSDTVIANTAYQPPYKYHTDAIAGIKASGTIEASMSDGVVTIHGAPLKAAEMSPSAVAVAGISADGKEYLTTPVVSSIYLVGDGGTIQANKSGAVAIGVTSEFGDGLEASVYNLNGVHRSDNELLTYMVFPGGRESALTISRHVKSTGPLKVGVWLHNIGSETVTANVALYLLSDPTAGSPVNQAPVLISESSLEMSESGSQDIYLSAGDLVPVEGADSAVSGTLIAKISMKPSNDFRIMRAGFNVHIGDTADTTARS